MPSLRLFSSTIREEKVLHHHGAFSILREEGSFDIVSSCQDRLLGRVSQPVTTPSEVED